MWLVFLPCVLITTNKKFFEIVCHIGEKKIDTVDNTVEIYRIIGQQPLDLSSCRSYIQPSLVLVWILEKKERLILCWRCDIISVINRKCWFFSCSYFVESHTDIFVVCCWYFLLSTICIFSSYISTPIINNCIRSESCDVLFPSWFLYIPLVHQLRKSTYSLDMIS